MYKCTLKRQAEQMHAENVQEPKVETTLRSFAELSWKASVSSTSRYEMSQSFRQEWSAVLGWHANNWLRNPCRQITIECGRWQAQSKRLAKTLKLLFKCHRTSIVPRQHGSTVVPDDGRRWNGIFDADTFLHDWPGHHYKAMSSYYINNATSAAARCRSV